MDTTMMHLSPSDAFRRIRSLSFPVPPNTDAESSRSVQDTRLQMLSPSRWRSRWYVPASPWQVIMYAQLTGPWMIMWIPRMHLAYATAPMPAQVLRDQQSLTGFRILRYSRDWSPERGMPLATMSMASSLSGWGYLSSSGLADLRTMSSAILLNASAASEPGLRSDSVTPSASASANRRSRGTTETMGRPTPSAKFFTYSISFSIPRRFRMIPPTRGRPSS